MYTHILIPTDGSELSLKAVRQGIDLAKSIEASVTLLTASAPFHTLASDPMMATETHGTYAETAEKAARARLEAGEAYAKSRGVRADSKHVFAEHPYKAIIDAVPENNVDLVFMASHGRKGVTGFLLGSETNKVLTHSKVPVLVCR